MHCNLRRPDRPTPRQSFSALITTHAKFEVAEPIPCRIIAFFADMEEKRREEKRAYINFP